jgi:hypothetical protein
MPGPGQEAALHVRLQYAPFTREEIDAAMGAADRRPGIVDIMRRLSRVSRVPELLRRCYLGARRLLNSSLRGLAPLLASLLSCRRSAAALLPSMIYATVEMRLLFAEHSQLTQTAVQRCLPLPATCHHTLPSHPPCSGVLTIHLEKAEGLGRAAHATGFTKK